MCITTLKLFDTLLLKCDNEILHNLVLRNLQSRSYMLPDENDASCPNSPPNTPESSSNAKSETSSPGDGRTTETNESEAQRTEFEQKPRKVRKSSERSLPDTKTISGKEQDSEAKKVVGAQDVDQSSGDKVLTSAVPKNSVIIHNSGDSNTMQDFETDSSKDLETNLITDLNAEVCSDGKIKVDVLTEIDSLVEDFGAGALAGALSVDCGKAINGEVADELSPASSLPGT